MRWRPFWLWALVTAACIADFFMRPPGALGELFEKVVRLMVVGVIFLDALSYKAIQWATRVTYEEALKKAAEQAEKTRQDYNL
jgi:hypothetical protein